ncbi:hypothetical protein SZ64_08830 [Erythrobacter sp. SG61-1L]|nr:hypothetical protein SZ64_08830 [Erythrobacter sp. SG61-1L]
MKRIAASVAFLPLLACQTIPDAPASPYSAEQIAKLRHYEFREEGDQWLLGLDGKLLFPTNGADLAADQMTRIGTMAHELAAVGIHGADVEGHADSIGEESYNMDLSLRRANAVRQSLVTGGMTEGRVQAAGLGETQPIASNETEEGRQENRRVVIIVSPDDVLPE